MSVVMYIVGIGAKKLNAARVTKSKRNGGKK